MRPDALRIVSAVGDTARLFVALEVPGEVRLAVHRWAQGLALRGWRPVPAENIHLTLCFLGATPVAAIDPVADCLGAVDGFAAPRLSLAAPVWLPRRRPRVLALAIEDLDGALSACRATLSAALVASGWLEPDRRPFLAHLTAARAHGERARRLERRPAVPSAGPFRAHTVTLLRSRLAPEGPRYEPLASVSLVGLS